MTSLRITILVDNQAPAELIAEHGFSLWIESGRERILLDTGRGTALEENARALGIKLANADILILSHGHYDHTGGISAVLKHSPRVNVCCHEGSLQFRCSIRGGVVKPNQMPPGSAAALKALPAGQRFWVHSPLLLTPRIGLTGPIPRETGYEDPGGSFYLDSQGSRPDMVEDEIALWIKTADGPVICVGCCHAGLVNTLTCICRLSGESRIRAILGGFHLSNADERRLELTVDALRSFAPTLIVPCHCTGERAIGALRAAFQAQVVKGCAGAVFNF